MAPIKVGIREFRAGLASFLESPAPIAVTRHGQIVGYFVPTPGPNAADLAALAEAGRKLDRLLEERGVDPEDLVTEFKRARGKKPKDMPRDE